MRLLLIRFAKWFVLTMAIWLMVTICVVAVIAFIQLLRQAIGGVAAWIVLVALSASGWSAYLMLKGDWGEN